MPKQTVVSIVILKVSKPVTVTITKESAELAVKYWKVSTVLGGILVPEPVWKKKSPKQILVSIVVVIDGFAGGTQMEQKELIKPDPEVPDVPEWNISQISPFCAAVAVKVRVFVVQAKPTGGRFPMRFAPPMLAVVLV